MGSFSLVGLCASILTAAPLVTIDSGAIEGLSFDGQSVFLGIPFAAAPTGDRRWMPPKAVAAWRGVRRATAFGATCPQAEAGFQDLYREIAAAQPYYRDFRMDEDCLYLNVWTKHPGASAKLP